MKPLIAPLLVGAALTTAGVADAASKPNILLLYADDLGYGDVSCYGATHITTPNIDRLAKEGLRFTDGHCGSSTCTPSRYAMLTGEYAFRKKGTGVLPGDAALIIEPGRTTIASVLKSAGYATGIVGKWHLGLGAAKLDWNDDIKPGPLELDFDYCFLMPATGDRVPCVYVENHRVIGLDPADPIRVSFSEKVGDEPTGREHPELLKMHPSHGHDQTIVNGISRIGYMSGGQTARWSDEGMADEYVKRATAFIEQHKDGPFFLELATHDIHVPHVPNARFVGKSDLGVRGDAIVEFDACVGAMLGVLEKYGLTQNTLVIFSSDNGPVVDDGYRDGSLEKLAGHKPAGPWRGGKYSIFEGGTRVPFVVRWPGRVKPGVSEALVSQVDFAACFAALTGQTFDPKTSPDSQNVLPALLGDSPTGRTQTVEHSGGVALRSGPWKFIPPRPGQKVSPNTHAETGNDPTGQLYNLASDLGETKNVAAEHEDKVREFAAALAAERAKAGDATGPAK